MRRIHVYRQLEQSDCGPTCIRIVARWHGKKIPAETLRDICDTTRSGITIRDILNSTQALGMESQAVRLTLNYVYSMPLPAILYWEQKHFTVLYKVDPKRKLFYLVDPGRGKLRLNEEEFRKAWMGESEHGVAVLVDSTPEFQKRTFPNPHKGGLANLLKKTVSTHHSSFIAVILLTLVTLCAEIAMPLLFQHTIDDGLSKGDIALVWMLILGQLMVFIGNYVGNMVSEFILTRLGLKVSFNMLGNYLHKIVKLPMDFFERKSPGDLMQKIDEHQRIRQFLVSLPGSMFFTCLSIVVFSGILIWLNLMIFAIFIGFAALISGWTAFFMRKRRQLDYTYVSNISENRNHVYELIYGMPEIKTNNAQDRRVGIWEKQQSSINRLTEKSTILDFWLNGGTTFLTRLRDIAVTGICATLVIQGHMTLGAMMTVNYIVGRLGMPFGALLDAMTKIQDAAVSYERVEEVMHKPLPEEKNAPVPEDADLMLDNVSFKYPGSASPMVISNLSLRIRRGSTIALVGSSGCGKTTLIKLMLGFFNPVEGSIAVGGTPLSEIGERNWLSHCGCVMQDGYIFSGTIMSNVAISDEEPDTSKVEEALKLAGLLDFVKSLPMGLNTRIGATGTQLSGGQKQRLFIARAFYKQPEFLFFDEATSSLDAKNERDIVRNLERWAEDRTVIIAAHRLSTVKGADCIVFMEKGRIVECGTHDELTRLRGAYYNLVQNQLTIG